MDRVKRDRNAKLKGNGGLGTGATPQERHAAIVQAIAEIDKARRIRLSSQDCRALLDVCSRRLFRAEIQAPGTAPEVIDAAKVALGPGRDAVIARLNAAMSELCARSDGLVLEYQSFEKPRDLTVGVPHELLGYDAEAAIESLWETSFPRDENANAPSGDTPASDVLQLRSPLPSQTGAASLKPFEFLEGCRPFADSVSYFSEPEQEGYGGGLLDDIAGDRHDLPTLAAWYDTVTGQLGNDLYVIAIPADKDEPSVAFALNHAHGAGVRFRRVNFGHVARLITGSG
ncbi:hypothetical protein [Defluviimonas sp. WL0075]|uniref:Uncharacterized protein n=1 Tax=Albidovulum sediminicola TaxID=2984331 RepID=A0ABT2Z157_9RHOB|nr:hypothetical protein [Defluviimonas sp. WL0075]MCV2864831.1 hypothetical protein [Defluviimonas sp. WL0075]